jgi:hypothetical protein
MKIGIGGAGGDGTTWVSPLLLRVLGLSGAGLPELA